MKKLLEGFAIGFLVVALTTGIANSADVTSDMVGHWPLDGNVEDTVGDNDGKLIEGADWVDNGKLNGAVELDGSTGYVEIPDFTLTSDTVTLVAWINGWKAANWAAIVCDGANRTGMNFGDNDTLHYMWNNDAQNTWSWSDGPVIPQNEWAMTALTIEPDKATAYVYSGDELKQGVNQIDHLEQTIGAPVVFGWDNNFPGDRHFEGSIDEVIIYDRTLTEDDILELASGGIGAAVEPSGKLTTIWGKIKQ